MKKRIVILGSTGSIGTQTLEVVNEHKNLFSVEVLTANNNCDLLIDQAKKYSHISFVRDLVSSVDNFKRALDSLPEDKADLPEPIKNLIIGLEIVEKEINSTFEKHNLKQISPLGEKFDYNFHQAMFEVPTNDTEPGIVIEVSQIGYLLYDRLVRPAMVGISKKIEENNKDNDNQEEN